MVAVLVLLGFVVPARAQGQPGCVQLCGTTCIKPFSIPDRWDDVTAIPGYSGGTKRPNWRNNTVWDSEAITNDVNGNGLYDPGDGYLDGNANGVYDSEAFDALGTGYVADPGAFNPVGDLGLEITLKASVSLRPSPGQFLAIDLPPVNRGTPVTGGDPYRENIAACNAALVASGDRLQIESSSMVGPTNQGMRDLIAQDPDAYWDPISQSVQGSKFTLSPRVIFLPIHDPRLPITSASNTLKVTKVVAFFMEQMEGNAEVRGRFLRVVTAGEICSQPGDGAGFLYTCPTPARGTSWGRVKDHYR
jgi:hypothetical protein